MEERKRPAVGSADELAPPSKRLAVNGSKHKDDALEMKEESWVEVRATRRAPLCLVLEPHAHRPFMPIWRALNPPIAACPSEDIP